MSESLRIEQLFAVADKVAVVTGGSRGIGYAIARALAVNGARVYIASRNADECRAAAEEIAACGASCQAIPIDLSTDAECRRLAGEVRTREAKLDILVNNAGTQFAAPLVEYPEAAFDKLWAVNVKAVFRLTAELHALLVAASRPDSPARVINIGSVEGLTVGAEETYAYGITKAGVHFLTRKLSRRFADDNVTVNAVAPGYIDTKLMAYVTSDAGRRSEWEADVPLHRLGRPVDVAGVVMLLCSPAGSYLTGTLIPVDGGLSLGSR